MSIDDLVNRFLQWKLPDTVCADMCATDREYAKRFPGTRCGTNLLSANETRQMIQYLLAELSDSVNGTPCAEIRWQQERETLTAQIEEARKALKDCANPMQMIRREAEKNGKQINGVEAVRYCESANNIKEIARAALARLSPPADQQEAGVGDQLGERG